MVNLAFFHTLCQQLSWLVPASCTERLQRPNSEVQLPHHLRHEEKAQAGDGSEEEDVLESESHGGMLLSRLNLYKQITNFMKEHNPVAARQTRTCLCCWRGSCLWMTSGFGSTL